jgi:hypothetical protein
VIRGILVVVGLLQHLICQFDELLGVQLRADCLILGHIVEQREDFLSRGVCCVLSLSAQLPFHEQIQNLGFVLHELLVLCILGNSIQESDDALIELHLMIIGEIDDQCIIDNSLIVLQ